MDISTKYNSTVIKYIAKMAKRMTAQMKPHTFYPIDQIMIIISMKYIKLAHDANGVHESAAM